MRNLKCFIAVVIAAHFLTGSLCPLLRAQGLDVSEAFQVWRYTVASPNQFTMETGNLLLNGTFRTLITEYYTVPSVFAPVGTMEQVASISGKVVWYSANFDAYKAVGVIPRWVRSTQTFLVGIQSHVIICISGICDPNAAAITVQPTNKTVTAGQNASFTVAVSGSPTPNLQWQRKPVGSAIWSNVTNGGAYAGSTTATLTISAATTVMSGDQFRGVASNTGGSATSNPATLTVDPAGQSSSFRFLAGTGNSGFYPFTLSELKTSPVTTSTVISNIFLSSLDFAPDGQLYGASDLLYRIDPNNGAVTTVGTIHSSTRSSLPRVDSIAFSPEGILYAVIHDDPSTSHLYTLNVNNALGTVVGPISGGSVWGIDFASDGRLFGAFTSLYLLNRNTGQIISKVGDLAKNVTELDFAPDGFLYGVGSGPVFTSSILYRISPKTGTESVLGEYTVLWGLASEVPRPSLKVSRQGSSSVLSWPTNDVGFILTYSTNVSPSSVWNAVSVLPVVVNGLNTVTNTSSGTARFYRLRKS